MTQTIKTIAGLALAMLSTVASSAAPKEPQSCKPLPLDKRAVRFNLEPDTKLGDLIAWISEITCKQFLLPHTISPDWKVTVIAPALITPAEAYRLLLGALDSQGLTIEHTSKFERIVEAAKIKPMGGVPVFHEGNDAPSSESYVTRLIRPECLHPNELARLLKGLHANDHNGDGDVFMPKEPFVITDTRENMNRLLCDAFQH
jgi:GspD-like, N0 domain